MKRIPPMAVALTLVLGACGRSASSGEGASAGPTVGPTVEAAASSAPTGATFSEFPANPPIWSLGRDETEEALHGWFWGSPEPVAPCGWPGSDDDPSSNPCVRSYFRSRGVSDAAIDLLFRYGISVFGVEGAGPVKVVQIEDWEESIVGNVNLATEADHYYILTPMGKLETWPSRGDEGFEDPGAESVLQALEDYFRAQPEFSESDDSAAILEFSVGSYVSAPIETADGWTVDIQSGIRAGCSGCGIPFMQRSALLFSADGTPTDYQLIDVCYRGPYGGGDTEEEAALAEIGADLPMCDSLPDA